jgi:hypothetical protein
LVCLWRSRLYRRRCDIVVDDNQTSDSSFLTDDAMCSGPKEQTGLGQVRPAFEQDFGESSVH